MPLYLMKVRKGGSLCQIQALPRQKALQVAWIITSSELVMHLHGCLILWALSSRRSLTTSESGAVNTTVLLQSWWWDRGELLLRLQTSQSNDRTKRRLFLVSLLLKNQTLLPAKGRGSVGYSRQGFVCFCSLT